MPYYDYECPKCKQQLSEFRPIQDGPDLDPPVCPCGEKTEHVFLPGGTILFKGLSTPGSSMSGSSLKHRYPKSIK